MKGFIHSLFSDSEWDADLSKCVGFAMVVVAIVGFFLEKDSWQWLLGFGAGLIGWKAKTENV